MKHLAVHIPAEQSAPEVQDVGPSSKGGRAVLLGIEITADGVSATVAAIALLLGLRSEVRARRDAKQSAGESSSRAIARLSLVLKAGESIPLDRAVALSVGDHANLHSPIRATAAAAWSAIDETARYKHALVLTLIRIADRCGRLEAALGATQPGPESRAWLLSQFRDLYMDLHEIAVACFVERRSIANEDWDPIAYQQDPALQMFERRALGIDFDNMREQIAAIDSSADRNSAAAGP